MSRLRSYLSRIGGLFRQQRADHDLTAELESHLQMQIDANLKAGMSPEEARRQALIQLGGLEATKEAYRDQRSIPWLENLFQDIRFGLRQLRKHPAFTAVALLTLAIGIGANTTIFSIIHGILLKPLPYPEPHQLVTLWERDPSRGIEQDRVSGPNYLDWRAQNSVFSEMAVSPAWHGSDNFNLVLRDSITKVRATHVGWLELGDFNEANTRLDQLAPPPLTHPEVVSFQFDLFAKAQKWDNAVDVATALVTANAKDTKCWLKLAHATRHCHGVEPAYEILKSAHDQVSFDSEIPYQLACLAIDLGQVASAEHWLKLAFTLANDSLQKQNLKLRALEDPHLVPLWQSYEA